MSYYYAVFLLRILSCILHSPPRLAIFLSLNEWMDATNVDSFSYWTNLEVYSAICIYSFYYMWTTVWLLPFVCRTNVKHDFVTYFIYMWYSLRIFTFVIFFVLNFVFLFLYNPSLQYVLCWKSYRGQISVDLVFSVM